MAKPTDLPMTHRQFDIENVKTIDDVIGTFEQIIGWSMEAKTPIGYFAVIYKQATVAIHDAIKDGKFTDPERMVQFQLTFARRYFKALNDYNSEEPFKSPTHVWKQSFDANALNEPIIFQHLLTGLNAHMNLDLGVAAATVGRGSMQTLRCDFNVVNSVLGHQVEGVLDAVAKISPVINDMRDCMVGENGMFRGLIVVFRELAWQFAMELTEEPKERNVRRVAFQDTKYDDLGTRYIYAPAMFEFLVSRIAAEESRDVVENIRVLNRMSTPSWDEIAEYGKRLDDAGMKSPPADDDAFFERCAEILRKKALRFFGIDG
jgi:hypothetical protein